MTAAAALLALAETPLRDYLDESGAASGSLITVHQHCISAGLLRDSSPTSDAALLHAIFDVAVDHGLGSVVLDYVAQVCLGNSSHQRGAAGHSLSPLADPHCVGEWLQTVLVAAREELTSGLAQGLAALASSQVAPCLAAKLSILVLIAETLSSRPQPPQPALASNTSSSRSTRRILAESGAAAASAWSHDLAGTLTEAQRLLQCAQVLECLAGQDMVKMMNFHPTGRFDNEAAWRQTVAQRQTGAGATPLFLADLIDAALAQDVDPPAYPPSSPESFLAALFLSGAATREALHAKLALLSYSLIDAGIFPGKAIARSLSKSSFGIPPPTTLVCWMLLLLDDVHIRPPSVKENSSLAQAAAILPGIDGGSVPFRVLHIFLERGRADVALALLRQRRDMGGNDVAHARTTLRIRLANGLIVESFIEMKRHLAGVPEPQRAQHVQQLMHTLFEWASASRSLNAIIRLPVSPGAEENAAVEWMKRSMRIMPESGLILSLYLLMRGRVPEALLAYSQLGGIARIHPELDEAAIQLEELLRAAAKMLPGPQKALVVSTTREPTLRLAGRSADADMAADFGGVGAGGGNAASALAAALPGLDAGGMPAVLSSGPSFAEAPLVGGVVATLAATAATAKPNGPTAAAGGGAISRPGGAAASATPAPSKRPTAAMEGVVFQITPPVGAAGAQQPSRARTQQFGAVGRGDRSGGAGKHQLDKMLGLTPPNSAKASRGLR